MNLDLSLPEPETPRRTGRGVPLLLFAIVCLLGVLVARDLGRDADDREGPLDADLAESLEKKTLYSQAGELWEALAADAPDPAVALYRAGRSRMLGGEHARALRDFYAAEAAGLSEELAAETNRHVLECLAVLGKFDVRSAEMKRRTGGEAPDAGDVVAEVGEEKVTREDLADAIRDEESMRLLSLGALDREKLDAAVAARLDDPAKAVPVLAHLLSRRALALEAQAAGLEAEPVFRRRLAAVRRELLGNRLLERRLLEGVTVSEADLRDHYEAHRDRYVEPAAVRFSWTAGDDAAALAPAEGWHAKGDPFPGGSGPDSLGRSAEADAILFALEPGQVADRRVTIAGRDVLLRTDEKRPERALGFEEARDRVTADLLSRKRAEAIQALRAEVEAKHPPKITDESLRQAYEEGRPGGR
jgi:hypothetical protein